MFVHVRMCVLSIREQCLPHNHQVMSTVWWAPRDPCNMWSDPIHIHWLALHGGVGDINDQIQLCMCVCVCVVIVSMAHECPKCNVQMSKAI